MIRHVWRVQPMHFGCVGLIEQHSVTCLTRLARLALTRQRRRDVTWQTKWNLGLWLHFTAVLTWCLLWDNIVKFFCCCGWFCCPWWFGDVIGCGVCMCDCSYWLDFNCVHLPFSCLLSCVIQLPLWHRAPFVIFYYTIPSKTLLTWLCLKFLVQALNLGLPWNSPEYLNSQITPWTVFDDEKKAFKSL